MISKPLTRSFAAGEITPELYARIDLTMHQTGLAKALNFWTLPHGPAQNRPGFEYILETKDSTKASRAIEFSYNTEQTFVLEFGDQYIRFHTNGGTLLNTSQVVSAITNGTTPTLTYVGADPANGDWVYLTATGMTEMNGRWVKVSSVNAGANTFVPTGLDDEVIDTTDYGVFTSGTMSPIYELSTPYLEADLFKLKFTQSADVLTLTHPTYAPRELRRLSATNWTLTSISFVPTIATPAAPTLTENDTGGTPVDVLYKVTAIASDTLEESLASAAATANIDLTFAGNYVDVDPPTVANAIRYNVYKLSTGGLYGYIGQTDGSALRDNNITPDVSRTPAIASTPFSGTGDYPEAVGYFEGRRGFAGTNNKPQSFWLTRSGTESNLSYKIPTQDDDAISGTIRAQEVNRIRHIVPMADLVLLTSGGEVRIAPQNSDILTPASTGPKQASTEGASDVKPLRVGSAALYAESLGGRVRVLDYMKSEDGASFFESRDVCVMAPHLFDGYTIVDAAYVKRPYRMSFFVRSDGLLLGLTYLREHKVEAWHQHSTDGTFESVAAVAEGTEYSLYAIVKRTINGRDVRYVERMRSRRFATLADSFVVDSGLTYSGTAATTIRGLWHLEGETVSILADGAVAPRQVVTDGAITLDEAATKVHIGLPITADFQQLPLAIEAPGFGLGDPKNMTEVSMRVHQTSGLFVGPSFTSLREYPMRTSEAYGSPPGWRTGTISLRLDNKWGTEAQLCVRQTDPLPVTILATTVRAASNA